MTGVYTATSTVPGCGSISASTFVQVNQSIQNVSGWTNSPLCSGQTLMLSATDVPGASYLWQGPDGFSANTRLVSRNGVDTTMAGSYSLFVSQPGCGGTRLITSTVTISSTPGPIATIVNSPTCVGNPVYLNATNANGMTSYQWTGPNGFISNIQNPSINTVQLNNTGIYTLMVTHPACGLFSTTVGLQVNPNVLNVLPWSNAPLCNGQNLMLSATDVAGASYLWQGPDGFTANTRLVTRNNVNTTMAGNYSLFVSQAGCAGTRMVIQSVSISNIATAPTASIVNSPSCVGDAVFLNSTNVTGATSFQWAGPNGYVANVQNTSISNVQLNRQGVYTLTVTHPSCGVFVSTVGLIVNPKVNSYTIVSATPGCIGSTLSLSATIPTGGGTITHLWRAPNGTTFNTPGFTIVNAQVADAGTYTYTVNSPACGTNTRTIRYVINDPSLVTVTNNGPLCRGAAANFSATGVTGTTYSWTGPASYVSSTQFATRTNVQLNHAGEYTLNATVPGCGVTTRTTTLVVNSCRTAENSSTDGFTDATGFENSEIDQVVNKENQERLSNLKVYPNPFHEELSLTWSEMKVFSVKLYDLSGKLVYEAEPGQDGVEFTVRITDLPNGVYLLTVQTSAGPMSYRVTRL
jgi:rRNA maturation protein Nop10